MLKVTTDNSVYLVDTTAKTWERVENNGDISPAPLRTFSGTFNEITGPVVGNCLMMVCPPLNPMSTGRLIITSVVKNVEELDGLLN